jgi:hypothetical protein
MLTLRPIDEDGEWGAKSRKEYILDRCGERIKLPSGEFKTRKINAVDWNEHTKAEEWRAAWGAMQNAALEFHGAAARVDHRSYKRQGVQKIPQVRMGVTATQMARRGTPTLTGTTSYARILRTPKISGTARRTTCGKSRRSAIEVMTESYDGFVA